MPGHMCFLSKSCVIDHFVYTGATGTSPSPQPAHKKGRRQRAGAARLGQKDESKRRIKQKLIKKDEPERRIKQTNQTDESEKTNQKTNRG